ncbi:unnamed protein product [Paramecium pentaurelia]|uniref:Ubiquitin-like protease family profile domain-containing protein n=1 Tax=Paramecium pentaurelia TaxID=43138 RepID=A0A8S1SX89_9CILI|nr:unnamed protein product [Paramecium pentaurelia]
MGNNCVSESDSLINEDTQAKFNKIESRPGIYAVEHSTNTCLESISIMSSPDSAYPITFKDNMDVIAFKGHKYAILERHSVYYGEINQKYQKNGKGKLYLQDVDKNGNQKLVIKKGIFKNNKYLESGQISPKGECLDETLDSKITEAQDLQNSLMLNEQYKYNKFINDKDLNSIRDTNQLRSNIVNGYIQYLQQLDEKLYWDTPPHKREKFERTIIFQSNCQLDNYDEFTQLIKQFRFVKFWLIYKKIGFVIEHNPNRWYFVEVQITEDEFNINIYDSIKCSKAFYSKITLQLTQLFQRLLNHNLEAKVIIKDNIPQSYNTYDSAVYTCIFARMLRCNCRNKVLNLSPSQMRSDLERLFVN